MLGVFWISLVADNVYWISLKITMLPKHNLVAKLVGNLVTQNCIAKTRLLLLYF